MTKYKWRSLVVIFLLASLLLSSCSPAFKAFAHEAYIEIEDHHISGEIDLEKLPSAEPHFERVEIPEVGENAATIEADIEYRENVIFISDELAKNILSTAKAVNGQIHLDVEESEARYKQNDILVHEKKQVAYRVAGVEKDSATITYILVRPELEDVFEKFEISHQIIKANPDNLIIIEHEGINVVVKDNFLVEWEFDTAFGPNDEITVDGFFTVSDPTIIFNWSGGGYEITFDLEQRAELDIIAHLEIQEEIEVPLAKIPFPCACGILAVVLDIKLLIDIDGEITFVYEFRQGLDINLRVYGNTVWGVPTSANVEHDFPRYVSSSAWVEGELFASAGAVAEIRFLIFGYAIVEVGAYVGAELEAELFLQLTEPRQECLEIKIDALVDIYLNIDIVFKRWEIEIAYRRWELYYFASPGCTTQRCDRPERFFVISEGAESVIINSSTGNAGTTTYFLPACPITTVSLEAPEYKVENGIRKRFSHWDHANEQHYTQDIDINIPRKSNWPGSEWSQFPFNITAVYVDDPLYTLTVRAPSGVEILSPSGHDGVGTYMVEGINPGTEITIMAPEFFHSYPDGSFPGFDRWSGALESTQNEISFIINSSVTLNAHYSDADVIEPPVLDPGREALPRDEEPVPPQIASLYSLSVNALSSGRPVVQIEADITSATGHGGKTSYTVQWLESGTQVRLTAPEYVGLGESRYHFSAWSGAVAAESPSITLEMDSHKNVTALYTPAPETVEGPARYTLNVNSSGDDKAGVDIASNTGHGGKTNYQITNIASQAKIHLEAPEYLGSGAERKRFSSWSGAVSSSNRIITLEMDNNKTVTANYIDAPAPIARPRSYTLTVTSSVDDPSMKIGAYITSKTGHGGTTPYTITGIEEGTQVHLEAPDGVDIGTNFTGWSGDLSDKNRSITFTLDSDKAVRANYWWELY